MTDDLTPRIEALAARVAASLGDVLRMPYPEAKAHFARVLRAEVLPADAGSPTGGDLRDRIAEALALKLNGPASDGRGWYRTAAERIDCLAQADAVMAALAAHFRAATKAIRDSDGVADDPLAAAIWEECRRDGDTGLTHDDPRNIARVVYEHLANRITRGDS